jgi:hypothetical protein
MKNAFLLFLTMALLPACAFAVDGVVLINQSTVMAAGGFPYVIMQPNSYKLSGNLTMNTTPAGNLSGKDVAIAIASSGVTLDLNGFSITVINTIPSIGHDFFAIAETGSFKQITIKNGAIALNYGTLSGGTLDYGVYLATSTYNTVEGISVAGYPDGVGRAMVVGARSLVRHNHFFTGAPDIACPSVVIENAGVFTVAGTCAYSNNVL